MSEYMFVIPESSVPFQGCVQVRSLAWEGSMLRTRCWVVEGIRLGRFGLFLITRNFAV